MRAIVTKILRLLGNANPSMKPTAEMAQVWSEMLQGFSDAELWRAAKAAATRQHYGAPTVGDLIAEIRGAERVVHVPVVDLWNRGVIREDGSPVTQAQLVRWFPDGRQEVLALPKHEQNVTYDGGLGHIGADMDDLLDMGGAE